MSEYDDEMHEAVGGPVVVRNDQRRHRMIQYDAISIGRSESDHAFPRTRQNREREQRKIKEHLLEKRVWETLPFQARKYLHGVRSEFRACNSRLPYE